MRKMFLLAAIFAAMGMVANAQNLPKFELAGTYSVFFADIDVLEDEAVHGYGVGLQWNVNSVLGLVAEWSAAHGASGPVTIQQPGTLLVIPEMDTRFYTFLGGPRLTWRKNRFTIFGHYLVGMGNSKVEDEQSGFRTGNGEFAMATGGGIDINVGEKIAIRAAQFDYLPIHSDINTRLLPAGQPGVGVVGDTSTGWQHNTRFQAGVVFKFGSR